MRSTSTDRLVMLLLALVTVMLAGMLTSSWRVVLYPYLVVIGVVVLLGVGKRRGRDPVLMGFGVGVMLVYLALYIWLDVAMAPELGSSTDLVAGVVPTTAIYFFAIWPFGLVVAALYALLYRRIVVDDEPTDGVARRHDGSTGSGAVKA